MGSTINLEQLEELAAQLPQQEQLKLVAHLSERLNQLLPTTRGTDTEHHRREYAARVETFLKMCDENAAECIGEVDSAEDIRQIREERMSRL
jgi:phage baseplate assembly protein W